LAKAAAQVFLCLVCDFLHGPVALEKKEDGMSNHAVLTGNSAGRYRKLLVVGQQRGPIVLAIGFGTTGVEGGLLLARPRSGYLSGEKPDPLRIAYELAATGIFGSLPIISQTIPDLILEAPALHMAGQGEGPVEEQWNASQRAAVKEAVFDALPPVGRTAFGALCPLTRLHTSHLGNIGMDPHQLLSFLCAGDQVARAQVLLAHPLHLVTILDDHAQGRVLTERIDARRPIGDILATTRRISDPSEFRRLRSMEKILGDALVSDPARAWKAARYVTPEKAARLARDLRTDQMPKDIDGLLSCAKAHIHAQPGHRSVEQAHHLSGWTQPSADSGKNHITEDGHLHAHGPGPRA
jgi:hypothetical protein